MEKTCEYKQCVGCGVCATECPTGCITFVTRQFGHVYPKIDTSRCIDCGKCRRVCPALNEYDAQYPLGAYAGIIKDRGEYLTTTSGGAAQALSLHTLRNGGVVYGCASLPEAKVEHIRVDNPLDLELLKGSKYVQSEAWKVNSLLKEDVDQGKRVLFIGTPCQVAAVRSLYPNRPANLALVEIICHGVPSRAFLKEYLRGQGVTLSAADRIWFRTSKGFQIAVGEGEPGNYRMIYESIPLSDGKRCRDVYYKTFFFGYSYRSSCYRCKFARPERVGDITIGDFWGLGAEIPAEEIPPHPDGISVILPTSQHGREILDEIRDSMSLYPRPPEEAIRGNAQLRHPTRKGFDVVLFNLLRRIIPMYAAFRVSFFLRIGVRYVKKRLIKKRPRHNNRNEK